MKNEIKVGQDIWYRVYGRRMGGDGLLHKSTVSKVGKKYFEIADLYGERFFIDSLTNDGKGYSSSCQAYLSEQDRLDEVEVASLSQFLRNKVGQYGLAPFSLDQLRRIKAIIEEPAP